MTRLAWLLCPDGNNILEVNEKLLKLAKDENPPVCEAIRQFGEITYYRREKDNCLMKAISGGEFLRILDGISGDGKCAHDATLSQAMEMAESYGKRLRLAAESELNFTKFVGHIVPEIKNRHPLVSHQDLQHLARVEARRRVAEVDPRFGQP